MTRRQRMGNYLMMANQETPSDRETLVRLAVDYGGSDREGKAHSFELEEVLDMTLAEVLLEGGGP